MQASFRILAYGLSLVVGVGVLGVLAADPCGLPWSECTSHVCCENSKDSELDECDRIENLAERRECLKSVKRCFKDCKKANPIPPTPPGPVQILSMGDEFMFVPEGSPSHSYSFTFSNSWGEGDYYLTLYNGHPSRSPNTLGVQDVRVLLNGDETISWGTITPSVRKLSVVVHLTAGINVLEFDLTAPPTGGLRFVDPYLSTVALEL